LATWIAGLFLGVVDDEFDERHVGHFEVACAHAIGRDHVCFDEESKVVDEGVEMVVVFVNDAAEGFGGHRLKVPGLLLIQEPFEGFVDGFGEARTLDDFDVVGGHLRGGFGGIVEEHDHFLTPVFAVFAMAGIAVAVGVRAPHLFGRRGGHGVFVCFRVFSRPAAPFYRHSAEPRNSHKFSEYTRSDAILK